MRRHEEQRLRIVEVGFATQAAKLDSLLATQTAMETRIMGALDQLRPEKPEKPWPAISASAALVIAILAIVAAFYNR